LISLEFFRSPLLRFQFQRRKNSRNFGCPWMPTNDNDSLAARDETAPVFQDHVLELRAKDSVVAGW